MQPAGRPVLAGPQFRVGLQKQIDLVRREARVPELELADGLEPIERESCAQVLIRHQLRVPKILTTFFPEILATPR